MLFLVVLFLVASVEAVWPAPRQFFQGQQLTKLSNDFNIDFGGSLATTVPSDLQQAVATSLERIRSDLHPVLRPDRGESDRDVLKQSAELTKLELRISRGAAAWLVDTVRTVSGSYATASISEETAREERDESYALHIPPTPSPRHQATLTAATSLGLLRGLQTFIQLVYTLPAVSRLPTDVTLYASAEDSTSPVQYLRTPVSIRDEPAFAYRGLLVDTSRNFLPIMDLKRTVDAMSWGGKLNTLHW